MKKKIIIFIGEWWSEKSFFKEFLNINYIRNIDCIKNEYFYEINNNFIIFAHPVLENSWDGAFWRSITYIAINKLIEKFVYNELSCPSNLKDDFEFIYLFLTDKDKKESENKLLWVDDLIIKKCNNFKWEIKIIWAIKEIETWFLAWLWDSFKNEYPEVNIKELQKIYKKTNIEKIDNTKEILQNRVLEKTSIGWTKMQETVWREFWKYIDIEQAKSKSHSFKIFVEEIDNILHN